MDITNISQQDSVGMALDQSKITQLNRPLTGQENKKQLMKTAQQFEGVFLNQVLSQLDKTVDRDDDAFGSDPGDDTFRSLFYEKIADTISTRPGGSGLGLAGAIYRQLESKLPKQAAESTSP